MKEALLDLLCCPRCAETLVLRAAATDRDEISEGDLCCQSCAADYPIRAGIPRLVLDEHSNDPLDQVKRVTSRSFGFEWSVYRHLGWEAKTPHETTADRVAIERRSFFQKGLVEPEEFSGKLVLDAGCGNGRYARHAAELGAEVVAVDLSEAADAAYRNIGSHPRVHVVQADLLALPFRPATFDRIFSIGVLMHTGDAHGAFGSLARALKPGGALSVHVYRRGNAVYEWIDRALRRRTTRMEHEQLLRWSKRVEVLPRALYATRRLTLGQPIVYQLLNAFVRLEPGHHYIFDWYSAPVATHHTYEEVFGWFRKAGLTVTAHRDRGRGPLRRLLGYTAGGVTVKGRAATD